MIVSQQACARSFIANFYIVLSSSGFANGTPCDLYEDTAKEIAKLDVNVYDYDSDSDLEGESDDEVESRHLMATLPSKMYVSR